MGPAMSFHRVAIVLGFLSRVGSVVVPDHGVYIGAFTADQTMLEFDATTGLEHTVRLEYLRFPEVLYSEKDFIASVLDECKSIGAVPLLTVQTWDGLDMYTELDVSTFGKWLESYDMRIILRWNHEANGNWYSWGQQPTLYLSKFREFAVAVRRVAPRVEMAWTPNQEGGYPWGGRPGTSAEDQAAMDTNGDGQVTGADDCWSPFWPGKGYVDWIGMSFFWWGDPLYSNSVPSSNMNTAAWAKFHSWYSSNAAGTPLMIPETAAFYSTGAWGGDSEGDIKNAWVTQVYNPNTLTGALQGMKIVCWLNTLKLEENDAYMVDWRISAPASVSHYRDHINADSFFHQRVAAPTATPSHAPQIYPTSPAPTHLPSTTFPTPSPTLPAPTGRPSVPPTHSPVLHPTDAPWRPPNPSPTEPHPKPTDPTPAPTPIRLPRRPPTVPERESKLNLGLSVASLTFFSGIVFIALLKCLYRNKYLDSCLIAAGLKSRPKPKKTTDFPANSNRALSPLPHGGGGGGGGGGRPGGVQMELQRNRGGPSPFV